MIVKSLKRMLKRQNKILKKCLTPSVKYDNIIESLKTSSKHFKTKC